MWAALAILFAAGCVAVHLYWTRRLRQLQTAAEEVRNELSTLKDARAREAAENRLHQFAILNSVVEGVLVLDGSGRIQTVNRSLERLFRLERDVRGLTLMEAFRSHELLGLAQRMENEDRVQDFSLTVPGIQHTRSLQVNAAALGGTRLDRGVVMVFHDVTRITELEKVRKDFVANVSHELRTPLTLIKGCIETLIDGAKDDPEAAMRFLRTMERHTARLTFLIEDLLTLSQLESGKTVMHQQLLPVRPVVGRVIEELEKPAAEKRIVLENQVAPEVKANMDADRVQQVLFNLVENAIKYGRTGGKVVISARTLPDTVELAVEDDGPGIPPDARERVFERFYRVDRARSREAGGTGLGLAIVKHIVQAHGGRVWVESELDRGSTFFFSLPR